MVVTSTMILNKPYKDANWAKKMAMSVSDSDNQLHQLLFRLAKDANTEAGIEANKIVAEIDKMFKDYKGDYSGVCSRIFRWVEELVI